MSAHTIIIRTVNGEPMLSPEGMSLLYGVDPDVISARLRTNPVIPAEWLQAGRRRVSEAAASIGTRDLFPVLEYLANQAGQTIAEVPADD